MNIGKLYGGLKLGKALVHWVNNRSLWIGVAGYPYKKYVGHKCIHVMEPGPVNIAIGAIFKFCKDFFTDMGWIGYDFDGYCFFAI